MKKGNKAYGLVASLLASLFVAAPVAASDLFDLITASECSPADIHDALDLELVNGQWQFRWGHSGRASLECPIATLALNPDGPDHIGGYRVFFVDSDGAGAAASVTFRLGTRLLDATAFTDASVTNDSYPLELDGTYFIPEDIPVGSEFFFIRVDLYRNSRHKVAAFGGAYVGD